MDYEIDHEVEYQEMEADPFAEDEREGIWSMLRKRFKMLNLIAFMLEGYW